MVWAKTPGVSVCRQLCYFSCREAIVEIVFSEPFEAFHVLPWDTVQGIITNRMQVPLKNFGGLTEDMGLESNTLIILLCECADGTAQIKILLWSKFKKIWCQTPPDFCLEWQTKNQDASCSVDSQFFLELRFISVSTVNFKGNLWFGDGFHEGCCLLPEWQNSIKCTRKLLWFLKFALFLVQLDN